MRILVGHEPAANFGGRPRRDDGLGARPLVPAPDAVDLERRSSPVSFGRRETRFTVQGGQAVGLFQGGLIEWHPSELTALLLAQRTDAVVEAGHQDVPGRVLESHQDLGQGLGRIWRHPTQQSGVHVGAGHLDSKLDVDQAAQSVGDGRETFGHHGRVTHDAVGRLQPLGIGVHERLEVRAGDLFLALGDHLQVQGQLAGAVEPRLNRLPVQGDLALVVGRAAAQQLTILPNRFERR